MNIKEIENMSNWMRIQAIEMAYRAGDSGAHLGAGLSAIEILAVLYGHAMKYDVENPNQEERDIFIPSKAHCVLAYYTALAYVGFFPKEQLMNFEKNGSFLAGHPSINVEKGIEFSGGSLGMGLSQGIGVSLAAKRHQRRNKCYVLLGDGECEEGSVWEGIMSAAKFQLDNLIVIVDANKLQYDGTTEEIMNLGNLKDKFVQFGFRGYEVDGHDITGLVECMDLIEKERDGRPAVLIAHTIKGKGISFMENKKEWHHGVLKEQEYEKAMLELGGVCCGI